MNDFIVNSNRQNVSIIQVNNGKISIASADNLGDGRWWISRVNLQGVEKGRGLGSKLLQKLIEEVLIYGETNIIVAPSGYNDEKEKQFNFYKKNNFIESEEPDLLIYKRIIIETRICENLGEKMYKCPECGDWDYEDITHNKQCRICWELENHPETFSLTDEQYKEEGKCSDYIRKHNITPNLDGLES